MPEIPAVLQTILRRQHGAIAHAQALAAGVSRSRLNELRRDRALISAHRGVLVLPDAAGPLFAASGALLTQWEDGIPDGIGVSHETAARLWTPHLRLAELERRGEHLVVPPGHVGRNRSGVWLHRTTDLELRQHRGLPVTSPARTLVSLCSTWPRDGAVALADAFLSAGLTSQDKIESALTASRGQRGSAVARKVLGLARGGVCSVPESCMRLSLLDGGLPEPEVDLQIKLPDSSVVLARSELAYRKFLIWLEYDGFDVHSERMTFRADRHRQNWLIDRGWLVLRFCDIDLADPRRRLVAPVARAIEAAPRRVAALPASLSPEVAEAHGLLGITRR